MKTNESSQILNHAQRILELLYHKKENSAILLGFKRLTYGKRDSAHTKISLWPRCSRPESVAKVNEILHTPKFLDSKLFGSRQGTLELAYTKLTVKRLYTNQRIFDQSKTPESDGFPVAWYHLQGAPSYHLHQTFQNWEGVFSTYIFWRSNSVESKERINWLYMLLIYFY